jgi:chromosome segregation ATPase
MSFVARKMVEAQGQCTELTSRCKFLENSLSNELVVVANLRNKLKQIQSQSTDNEWRLQEQLAQLNSMLSKQRIRIEQLERELLEQTQPEHNIHNEDHHGGFMIFEDPQTSHQSMQLSKELHGNKDGKTPHQFPGKENSHAKRKTALGKIDPNNVIRSYASLEL